MQFICIWKDCCFPLALWYYQWAVFLNKLSTQVFCTICLLHLRLSSVKKKKREVFRPKSRPRGTEVGGSGTFTTASHASVIQIYTVRYLLRISDGQNYCYLYLQTWRTKELYNNVPLPVHAIHDLNSVTRLMTHTLNTGIQHLINSLLLPWCTDVLMSKCQWVDVKMFILSYQWASGCEFAYLTLGMSLVSP